MRRYVESVVNIGYPRVEIPGGMPHYPQVTMGDARTSGFDAAPPYVFQKSIVMGHLADRRGGKPSVDGREHERPRLPQRQSR